MKFVKGVLVGGAILGSVAMVYADNMYANKKKIMKKGRHLAKKVGLI